MDGRTVFFTCQISIGQIDDHRLPGRHQQRICSGGHTKRTRVRRTHEEDVDPVSQARLDARKVVRNNVLGGSRRNGWVRYGEIIATSGLGVNTACFEPNTLALLSMP